MPKDLFNVIMPLVALTPQAAVKTNKTGLSIDRTGFEGVDFAVILDTPGDTLSATVSFEFHIQDSPDNSVWTDVAAAFVQFGTNLVPLSTHTGTFSVVAASPAAPTVIEGGYLGIQKFVRCNLVVVGTHTNGTAMAITCILGHARRAPDQLGLTP